MRILSCEDHELFRDGLREALAALPDAPELVAARSGEEALRRLEDDPDIGLVLLDLGLPDVDGLDLLHTLRERHPLVGVAVLSASEHPSDMRAALDGGASGYIPKSAPRSVLVAALQVILAGGVYAPPELLRAAQGPEAEALTPRRREVAELMVKGLTNQEIGEVLGIGAGTVKTHVGRILEALDVSNRTEAVLALVDRGWVTRDRTRGPR